MRPVPTPSGVIPIVVLLAACGGVTASPSANAADATTSPLATASSPPAAEPSSDHAEASDEASTVVCPNPHGGACLGELDAGTYTTQVFETPLTYTVPEGWSNYEDLPGNFIVVPPSGSLDGIDAGTADYVGVYDGIAVADAECIERQQSGVDLTPAAMAAWFVEHEGLDTTSPTDVTVGGLEGVVVDLRIAESYTEGCPYEGYEGVPMVPMLIGAGPAEVHHVALGENVTRLYLLEGQNGRVVAIEVSDVRGGAELGELDSIVGEFVFSTED